MNNSGLEGFLPPDTTPPDGEGFVSYTVQPKASDATGTVINAQATVVFDTNAPINTPTATNTIDAGPPTSSVAPLPAAETTSSFTVSWSGQSDPGGSGIATYNVYVSENGGPYTLLQTDTTLTSATFSGAVGNTYGFYSVATDNVGNVQPTPTAAQATTTVELPSPTAAVNLATDFNLIGITADGQRFSGGLDGVGNAYSASQIGSSITFDGLKFTIGAAGVSDVVQSRGQSITLPAGSYSALTLLMTGVEGNQPNQTFVVHYTDGSSQTITQSISDWYTPQGYAGESVALAMDYRNTQMGIKDRRTFRVYGYVFDLNSSKTVASITLPNNRDVEVLAMDLVASVAAPTSLKATAASGAMDLSWTAPVGTITGYNIYRGTAAGGESSTPLNATPPSASATSYQDTSVVAGNTYYYVVRAIHGPAVSADSTEASAMVPASGSATEVDLRGAFNLVGITANGQRGGVGLDGSGNTLSGNLLGSSLTAGGVKFNIGAVGGADVVQSLGQTVSLPPGSFSKLELLATGVDGNQPNQTFVVHYTDGTSQTFTQSLSDWYTPQGYVGESVALTMAYRNTSKGSEDRRKFQIYDYAFNLESSKTVSSITLPDNSHVEVLAITAVP